MRAITAAVATAVCSSVLMSAARPQTPTFSTNVEVVRVDVLVTEHGQPVVGLKPDDFEISDNGIAQQVDLAAFDQIPLNVVLALDVSASMEGDRLDRLKAAGRAVTEGLARTDRVGLITFNHAVQIRSLLTDRLPPVVAALDDAVAEGETALVDAAHAGIILGESDAGRALVILFSDGRDTLSWLSPAAVLRTARRSDAVVYGVSAPTRSTPPFLKDLCEATGGRMLEIGTTENLTRVLLHVLEEFRHRYVVSYTPHGVSREGWHALDVRVKGRRASVKARPGYLAGPPS